MKRLLLSFAAGAVFSLVLLELALRAGGFVVFFLQERENRRSFGVANAYRILCLGESTTTLQYTRHLERILNSRDPKRRYVVINKGIPAAQTDILINNLEGNLDVYRPHMIVTMMGLNDRHRIARRSADGMRRQGDASGIFSVKRLKVYSFASLLAKEVRHAVRKKNIDDLVGVRKEDPGPRQGERRPDARALRHAESSNRHYMYGRHAQAEREALEALKLDPFCERAYGAYCDTLERRQAYPEEEKVIRKALELFPDRLYYRVKLGGVFEKLGKLDEAQRAYEKAIETIPGNGDAHIALWRLLDRHGREKEAKKVLENALGFDAVDDLLYRVMALSCCRCGKHGLADRYEAKANELSVSGITPATIENYGTLIAEASKRGIKVVCMWYPARDPEPLRKILRGEKGIVIVDNERLFKDRLKHERYEEYFVDECYGDFGHCTDKGNELLAGHAADVIARELGRTEDPGHSENSKNSNDE